MVQHSDIDHTGLTGVGGAIDWGETGDITDQDYDDVADAGVLNEAARADHLHGMPSAAGGSITHATTTVATNETLNGNNSFVDLATAGPAVTITVNTAVLVTVGAEVSWTGSSAASRYAAMGYAVSGANTVAASRAKSFVVVGAESSVNGGGGGSRSFLLTGLTPGSTTFTSKYNQLGTGATANWQNRELSVICLD